MFATCNSLLFLPSVTAAADIIFTKNSCAHRDDIQGIAYEPPREYGSGANVTLREGLTIPQSFRTYACIFSKSVNAFGAETGVNECGLVASIDCPVLGHSTAPSTTTPTGEASTWPAPGGCMTRAYSRLCRSPVGPHISKHDIVRLVLERSNDVDSAIVVIVALVSLPQWDPAAAAVFTVASRSGSALVTVSAGAHVSVQPIASRGTGDVPDDTTESPSTPNSRNPATGSGSAGSDPGYAASPDGLFSILSVPSLASMSMGASPCTAFPPEVDFQCPTSVALADISQVPRTPPGGMASTTSPRESVSGRSSTRSGWLPLLSLLSGPSASPTTLLCSARSAGSSSPGFGDVDGLSSGIALDGMEAEDSGKQSEVSMVSSAVLVTEEDGHFGASTSDVPPLRRPPPSSDRGLSRSGDSLGLSRSGSSHTTKPSIEAASLSPRSTRRQTTKVVRWASGLVTAATAAAATTSTACSSAASVSADYAQLTSSRFNSRVSSALQVFRPFVIASSVQAQLFLQAISARVQPLVLRVQPQFERFFLAVFDALEYGAVGLENMTTDIVLGARSTLDSLQLASLFAISLHNEVIMVPLCKLRRTARSYRHHAAEFIRSASLSAFYAADAVLSHTFDFFKGLRSPFVTQHSRECCIIRNKTRFVAGTVLGGRRHVSLNDALRVCDRQAVASRSTSSRPFVFSFVKKLCSGDLPSMRTVTTPSSFAVVLSTDASSSRTGGVSIWATGTASPCTAIWRPLWFDVLKEEYNSVLDTHVPQGSRETPLLYLGGHAPVLDLSTASDLAANAGPILGGMDAAVAAWRGGNTVHDLVTTLPSVETNVFLRGCVKFQMELLDSSISLQQSDKSGGDTAADRRELMHKAWSGSFLHNNGISSVLLAPRGSSYKSIIRTILHRCQCNDVVLEKVDQFHHRARMQFAAPEAISLCAIVALFWLLA